MTPEKIWKVILNGYGVERHNGIIYKFYIPTLEAEQEASIYVEGLEYLDGLPTRENLEDILREFVSEEDLTFFKEYEGKKKEKEILLGLSTNNSRKKLIENQLKVMASKYEAITKIRNKIIGISKETISYLLEADYFFYWGARLVNGDRLWDSIEDYEQTSNTETIWLQNKYTMFLNSLYNEEAIRSVAKVSSYRVKLKSWEDSNIPICKDVINTTEPLSSLLYWCHLYNNVISNSMEDIPDSTIKDNKKFDEFLEHMNNKHKTGASGTVNSSSKSGNIMSVGIIGK